MNVQDLMSTDVVSVTPETSLKELARVLAERGISGAPVLGEGGRILGVVSEADILLKERGDEPRRTLLDWLTESSSERAKVDARTVGEAMTAPAITIGAHTDISEAARTMVEQGVKRLPVIDWTGALVGIVTRADLVRAFARSDEEIENEIRTDLVSGVFWADPDALDVRVERGDVALAGELQERLDAELLPRLVARIPGVLGVRSDLGWRDDSRGSADRKPYASTGARRR